MAEMGQAETKLKQTGKSARAFRTIAEVAAELELPQHVLRFWESKFPQVRPLKRGGGRRYYRPEDVVLLRRIRDLLHHEGYTIRGAQKLLRQRTAKGEDPRSEPSAEARVGVDPPAAAPALAPALRSELRYALDELEACRKLLHGLRL
jgi:DNA-binding transcriptional MerR regulator